MYELKNKIKISGMSFNKKCGILLIYNYLDETNDKKKFKKKEYRI